MVKKVSTIDELRVKVEETDVTYRAAQETMNVAGFHLRMARANHSKAQQELHRACVEQAWKDGKAKHL